MTQGDGTREQEPAVECENAEKESLYDRALFEAAKDVLKSAISGGQDFCKFMATVATSGVAVYLALVKFTLPEDAQLSRLELGLCIIPALLLLSGAVVFIQGYLPRFDENDLESLATMKQAHVRNVARQKRVTRLGLALFGAGDVAALAAIIWLVSL